jgi:hypothetical protein
LNGNSRRSPSKPFEFGGTLFFVLLLMIFALDICSIPFAVEQECMGLNQGEQW